MDIDLAHALWGFFGGAVLGGCARWGRFCTLAAIEDFALGRDPRRLATWCFAIAVAILAVQGLVAATHFDPSASRYIGNPTSWFANGIGGILFGFGMALAGTCGFGVLARLGGGDFRALITLLAMAICGYATMRGLLSPLRHVAAESVFLRPPNEPMNVWFSNLFGVSAGVLGVVIAMLLGALALRSTRFRQHRRSLVTGTLVGLTVAGGWAVTAFIVDPFEPRPLESFTFTAPLGETLVYAMTSTGSSLNFGIGSVVGVVAGAALVTFFMRSFRWEACEDPREIRRLLLGGALMGFGGVLAFGCTVGQGLSAASLLAWSAPVSLAGMYVGAWLGLHWLVDGQFGAPLFERLLFWR